jgi:hypothetical protein
LLRRVWPRRRRLAHFRPQGEQATVAGTTRKLHGRELVHALPGSGSGYTDIASVAVLEPDLGGHA